MIPHVLLMLILLLVNLGEVLWPWHTSLGLKLAYRAIGLVNSKFFAWRKGHFKIIEQNSHFLYGITKWRVSANFQDPPSGIEYTQIGKGTGEYVFAGIFDCCDNKGLYTFCAHCCLFMALFLSDTQFGLQYDLSV
jgi:hypothetical protein